MRTTSIAREEIGRHSHTCTLASQRGGSHARQTVRNVRYLRPETPCACHRDDLEMGWSKKINVASGQQLGFPYARLSDGGFVEVFLHASGEGSQLVPALDSGAQLISQFRRKRLSPPWRHFPRHSTPRADPADTGRLPIDDGRGQVPHHGSGHVPPRESVLKSELVVVGARPFRPATGRGRAEIKSFAQGQLVISPRPPMAHRSATRRQFASPRRSFAHEDQRRIARP